MKRSFLIAFAVFSISCYSQNTETEYGKRIFKNLFTRADSIFTQLVPLNTYMVFVDHEDYNAEEREFYKSQAIEAYPKVKASFYKEAQRIVKFYKEKVIDGYQFEFLTATFVPRETDHHGYFIIRYSTKIDDQLIYDKIVFEGIKLNGHFYILDGFFEEVPED